MARSYPASGNGLLNPIARLALRLAAAVCLALPSAPAAADADAPPPRHPDASVRIVAHRGANQGAPENTLAAARLAHRWGVDIVEADVRTSRDGVLFVIHDATVDRTTGGTGRVAELTAAQLDSLDAGTWFDPRFAGEPVPRLRDFLLWSRGRVGVYLDLKDADPSAVSALIKDLDLADSVFCWSGDPALMAGMQAVAPGLAKKVNVDGVDSLRRAHGAGSAEIVEVSPQGLTPELLAEARRLGTRVMMYTNRPDAAAFRRAVELGVDLVNLDHPRVFIEAERTALTAPTAAAAAPGTGSKAALVPTDRGGFTGAAGFGHAHNDYYNNRPLAAALDAGMLSIEADVFLHRGELHVAHDPHEITAGRTLEAMYLRPLFEAFEAHGGPDASHPFGGRVRPSGLPVVLLVDFKSDGARAWPVLEQQLGDYPGLVREVRRAADGSTRMTPGPVIVVISGKRPIELIEAADHRRSAIDGRFPADLASDRPAHLMPMVSTSFGRLLREAGSSDPTVVRDVLARFARDAAARGRLARVWAAPDEPRMWQLIRDAGMQLINTDQPEALAEFLDEPTPQAAQVR